LRTKTNITNLKTTPAKYLGFALKTYTRRRLSLNSKGEYLKRAGWNMIIGIDNQRVVDRLKIKKFRNIKGKPVAKRPWAVLREEIINRYNSMLRGFSNYYFPITDRLTSISSIFYL
jgi:hypothetical protein